MSRRTPPRDRSTPRSRLAAVRDATTAVAVVVGAGVVLALEASADSGPLELRTAASSVIAPVPAPASPAAADVVLAVHHDPGAMAAARREAAEAAAARLAADREAERIAAEEAAAERAAERAAVWDRLADCESGAWDRDGRPVPGTATWDYGLRPSEDGFFQGGLQFHPVTWDEFRDADMPDHAGQASRAQQIAIAERVLEAQGWEAWPVCSKKLGYR